MVMAEVRNTLASPDIHTNWVQNESVNPIPPGAGPARSSIEVLLSGALKSFAMPLKFLLLLSLNLSAKCQNNVAQAEPQAKSITPPIDLRQTLWPP